MGKVFQQVVLLTRKNIRVRFSHRCLSFCELAIPGLITLLIVIESLNILYAYCHIIKHTPYLLSNHFRIITFMVLRVYLLQDPR